MTQKAPRATIIIPHYNQKECLERLLPSVHNQTFRDFEVIIIDDCTPDEATVSFIRDFIKDKPNMHLVQNAENMRFIKTCNKGIRLARGEYICLLNQDTEIKSTFVEKNVMVLDHDPTIGALSCIVVDQHGRNWFSGGQCKHGAAFNLIDDFEGVRPVDYVAGTAAFYRKQVFDKIGLFDEKLVMYYEDMEFGLRMKRHTDYRLCVFSDKLVTHFLVPSLASADKVYYGTRNGLLVARRYTLRHLPRLVAYVILRRVCEPIVASVPAMVTGKPSSWRRDVSYALANAKGTLHGLFTRQSHLTQPSPPRETLPLDQTD